MKILNVMSFLIERMKFSVRPYSAALIGYLPALWEESADHNMLRCAILTTLTNLVLVSHWRIQFPYTYLHTGIDRHAALICCCIQLTIVCPVAGSGQRQHADVRFPPARAAPEH